MINRTDVDIKVKDKSNTNGLHIAAAAGHQNVCSQLINREPRMMYDSDNVDQTALHMATRLPDTGFTEILEFHTPLPLGKFTCLDLLLKNHRKIMDAEDTEQEFKDAHSNFVNMKDKLSQTALSRAVEYGCSTTVNRLFKAGADKTLRVDSKNKRQRNMNMLHWAVSKDQIGVIDTLIRHGVDRSDKSMVPDHATPLTLAVKLNSYLATVKMLHYNNEEHNTLEIADKGPRTPLIWAVANGNSDILKALIGNGANVNYEADNQKLTALHFAAAKGDAEIVKILLDAHADFAVTDANGISPLDTALFYNNPTVLKALILHYQVQYGEDDDNVLSDMFSKAIAFANSQTINLNTAEDVQKREEVLKILEDAAAEHLESFMAEMTDFEYSNLDFNDYYADYYGDEFYQLSFYDNYYNPSENMDAKKRKKRSPRHLE